MGKKILVVVALVVLLGMFIGCDTSIQTSDAMSRGLASNASAMSETVSKGNKPVAFNVTVTLFQVPYSVETKYATHSENPVGTYPYTDAINNHFKTVDETLMSYLDLTAYGLGVYGGLTESDWPLLDNKMVIMNNVTNYNLDPTTALSGSNHSVINIVDPVTYQVVATLDANGTLSGSLAFGAAIDMNWVLKDCAVEKVNARGKVGGYFTWLEFDPTTGEQNPYYIPNGTFTLTGTHN